MGNSGSNSCSATKLIVALGESLSCFSENCKGEKISSSETLTSFEEGQDKIGWGSHLKQLNFLVFKRKGC